jgi:hypothetical protein
MMIWLPNKELVVPLPSPRVRAKGFFKLDAIRPDGRVRPLAGWFPNLITNVGLNRIGQGSYLTACQVGTDNTAPNVLDTALAGYLAGTTTRQAESHGARSTPPYYGWKRITYRFATGAAAGNIAEVAIASAAAFVGSVNFSRALVLDEEGDPTTVTVLGDEVLDVTYELRLYPPLDDVLGTFTVTGSGDHDYTLRAQSVTSSSWGTWLGNVANLDPTGTGGLSVRSGPIGAITSSPSGSSSGANVSNAAYGNNNLYRDGSGSYGLNAGNFVGGILSVSFSSTLGYFQYQVDPVIAKDSTKTLTLTNRVSWGRYEP